MAECDAAKRFENDLSSTLCDYAMRELCGLFVEYGFTDFEDVVDIYPVKPEKRKLSFSIHRMANMLGREVPKEEVQRKIAATEKLKDLKKTAQIDFEAFAEVYQNIRN